MKSRVYVIQDSPGKNLEPAKAYGDLTIMLTGKETNGEGAEKLQAHLGEFTSKDYILLIGKPTFIAMACIYAALMLDDGDVLQVLVWDRDHYVYNVEKILC